MRKKLLIHLALLLVIPGLLLISGCTAKKEIKSSEGMQTQAVQTPSQQTQNEEAAKKAKEQERIREEQLAAQKAQEMAAQRAVFENEDIHFAFDSDVLTSEAQNLLNKKADWLKANPSAAVQVQGNCDERGTAAYNMALGERRANSAKKFLVDLGVPSSQISTISFGKEKPLDPAHNEAAWAKNRREHFVIQLLPPIRCDKHAATVIGDAVMRPLHLPAAPRRASFFRHRP